MVVVVCLAGSGMWALQPPPYGAITLCVDRVISETTIIINNAGRCSLSCPNTVPSLYRSFTVRVSNTTQAEPNVSRGRTFPRVTHPHTPPGGSLFELWAKVGKTGGGDEIIGGGQSVHSTESARESCLFVLTHMYTLAVGKMVRARSACTQRTVAGNLNFPSCGLLSPLFFSSLSSALLPHNDFLVLLTISSLKCIGHCSGAFLL